MKRLILLNCIFLCLIAGIVHAAGPENPEKITWENLLPPRGPGDDPLAGLSEKEVDDIEWIIYLRQNLPKEVDPTNQILYDEVDKALPELKKKGIDVDSIITERKVLAKKVNKELDGRQVALSGYLLPLDFSGKSVSDFLLVPYVGACIHVPPPPPNQIVFAHLKTAMKFEMDELFKPLQVSGTIKVQSMKKNLFLVDGSDNVNIGYGMAVDKIEDYKE